MRQTFDDGRLTYTGFANQNWIIFCAARQHLHHATHFFVATNHRIELALPRQFVQIFRVTLQRLVLRLGILVGHFLIAAH